MTLTLTVLTVVPALLAVAIVGRAGPALRGTSLRLAWGWAMVAATTVSVAWIATGVAQAVPSPWDDMLWYGVAELLLCPLIAVLGARRPGVAVWNWFVLLPLLAVLGWPMAAAALAGARPDSFTLETPPMVGLYLVLVMGSGNYLGTRFSLSALFLVFAFALIIHSMPPMAHAAAPETLRAAAVLAVGIAAVAGWHAARRPLSTAPGPDRVWRDFRDQFGFVWAERVRERINQSASTEQWPVRLERSGFVRRDGSPASAGDLTDQRIEHALRWLLRRFVDDPWVDRRL